MISFNNTELIEGVIADRKSGSDGILYSYSKTGGTKSSFSNLFMRLTYTGRRNKGFSTDQIIYGWQRRERENG